MKILLDTNILIPLEDTNKPLDPSLADLRQLSESNGHKLFIHPSQKDDIQRDQKKERRKIVLSRFRQYQEIPASPQMSDVELAQYGWKQSNDNDRIDNLLLHALCRGAVHFLITNDKEIHKKARQAQVQEQVHYLDQFLAYLKSQNTMTQSPPFGIQNRYLYEFNVKQQFFNSLREGYTGFDNWYLSAAADHRKAWCISDNGSVQAICIYKVEDRPCIIDDGSPLNGTALKLCTFKVGNSVRGRKLGERLLFSAFKYSIECNIDYVYLHAFGDEHEMLISLCQEFGFVYYGKYKGSEDVYLKLMQKPQSLVQAVDPLMYVVRYYPHYLDNPDVGKYIIPIQPSYHNDLFADTSDNSRGFLAEDSNLYSTQSNTIKKAYICHAKTKQIRAGDLLLLYRTHDRKSIECLGITEQTYRGRDIDKVLSLVSKRTVYTRKEIMQYMRKDTLVILFRYLGNINPVTNQKISMAGIKGPIQSIRKITHEQYTQCFGRSN